VAWAQAAETDRPPSSTVAGFAIPGLVLDLDATLVLCHSEKEQTAKTWTTVRAILSNVKYTGRQVWNRQSAHHTPAHMPGPFRTQRWASTDQWVISKQLAHPALVSEVDFIAAQEVTAMPSPRDGGRRRYHLVGLLRCRYCGRRLESSWSHGRPAYRCQHGHSSAQPRGPDRLQSIYVREDMIIRRIRELLRDGGPPEAAD
jgi:site-specific DNA recombinase